MSTNAMVVPLARTSVVVSKTHPVLLRRKRGSSPLGSAKVSIIKNHLLVEKPSGLRSDEKRFGKLLRR
jgi:hypothetical protein